MWFEFAWEHIESGFACLFDVNLCHRAGSIQTYSAGYEVTQSLYNIYGIFYFQTSKHNLKI